MCPVHQSSTGLQWQFETLSKLLYDVEIKLYKSTKHSTHCIHQLFLLLKPPPPKKKLRSSHSVFSFPHYQYKVYKNVPLYSEL